MPERDRPLRVLLLGGDSEGNLGDRAILAALCDAIRARSPEAELVVVGRDPGRALVDFGARAVPPGPAGVLRLLREARGSALTVVGGGGLFQDDDSRVKMPYWGLRIATLRAAGSHVVGFSLGAGPLRFPESRLFAHLALACMESCSARDAGAQATFEGLGLAAPPLIPDPAFMLRPAAPAAAEEALRGAGVPLDGRPLLGVAARQWFHRRASGFIPHRVAWALGRRSLPGAAEREALYRGLARSLDSVVDRLGAHVVFLPTYTVPHEADHEACRAVADRMSSSAHSMVLLDEPRLYKAICGRLAVMLGVRMHPLILAAGMGTPVVGLAYNPKFFGFFDLLGMTDCLHVEALVAHDRSTELADRVVAASMRDRGELRERSRALARRTEAAFLELLPVDPPSA